MKRITERMLKLTAKACEKVAVKSCCKTSSFDTYQPKVPAAVRAMAEKNKAK